MTKRTCPVCSNTIHGRRDKKFCSDQCRTAFNNQQNSDANNFVRNINNILRKNRRILENFQPEEDRSKKVSREKLLELGFRFSYFTNIYATKAGKEYFFCYEYGYLPLDNDWYAIVKRKEYVE